jgi:chromosome segregation ATPase
VEPKELLSSTKESVKNMESTLSRFGTDLCDSIGNAMDNSFQQKPVPILDNLAKKLENPAQVITNSLIEEFSKICKDFEKNLTVGVNDKMEDLLEKFIDASNAISILPDVLDKVTKNLDKSVNSYGSISKSLDEHNERFCKLSDTFILSIDKINDAFKSLSELYTHLSIIPSTVEEAKNGITTASNSLKDMNEKISEKLIDASKINNDTGKTVQEYLNKIESIEKGLKEVFKEINDGLEQYSKTVKEGLQSMLNPFTTSVTDATQSIINSINPLHDTVIDLSEFNNKVKASIEDFNKTIQSLKNSINGMKDVLDKQNQQV